MGMERVKKLVIGKYTEIIEGVVVSVCECVFGFVCPSVFVSL
jgi:hypothetical protein